MANKDRGYKEYANECVRSMLAIDDVAEVMQRNRLRWFGHVERRDELCWIKRIETLQVDGDGVKGRPRKRWREVLREDMRKKGLCKEDALGQVKMEENVVGRP